ncbi:MAG: ergothioneine biosynthesis protein EgtB [Gemmataceae bacterium]|nr:ergothioneine biosynthesis protein EgtB [Gemmataceae bacterium]
MSLSDHGAAARAALLERYRAVRRQTEQLCAPLAVDDYQIQSAPEVSPPKWHLAHTTWFFETFLLRTFLPDYRPFHPRYEYLFNSYYETVGSFHPRAERGFLSRPTVEEVLLYRRRVDASMRELIGSAPVRQWSDVAFRLTLGTHHEQQHQELLLMDIKQNFASNPLRPAYHTPPAAPASRPAPMEWREGAGGLFEIGHDGAAFAYDNETPRHRVLVRPHRLASRLVTNGEYLEFIELGGYHNAQHWLADGWAVCRRRGWEAPRYWEKGEGGWWQMTLAGLKRVEEAEPVCHVSFYEADAFARWAGHRLPTEEELELATADRSVEGNFVESGQFHPAPDAGGGQWFGDVWEWTSSPYAAYPGFRPLAGALGEYNGKFMCNQFVLRGGCCVTPRSHLRPTYRNFFYPHDRWPFTGIRLARDA